MMNKTREAINNARVKHNIDLNSGKAREYMTSDWPWKFLWAQVEKELTELELASLKKTNEVLKGFESRRKSMQAKEWTRGIGYMGIDKDTKAKARAKASVTEELEKRCDKKPCKSRSCHI